MKNAKELLEEFTAASFRDPKKAAEMFSEDGAFEMPYLESVGVPGRYEGREAIERFFRFVREVYPDMDLENVKIMIDTPEQVFAEYEFTAQSSKTGRTIRTLFRASGRRERQDQASSRIGQPRWGCSRRLPQWARRLQGSIGTQGINMLRVAIIVGSTRPGRKGEAVARWVYEIAGSRGDAKFELVDIKDYDLPLLDESMSKKTH